MSISSIGGADSTEPSAMDHWAAHQQARKTMTAAMEAAAAALGMNGDELRGRIGAGSTMAQIAASRGTSAGAVATAVSDALTSFGVDWTAASRVANRVAYGPAYEGHSPAYRGMLTSRDAHRTPRPHPREDVPPPSTAPADANADPVFRAAAKALGISVQELRVRMATGQYPAEIAAGAGKDPQELSSAVADAARAIAVSVEGLDVNGFAVSFVNGDVTSPASRLRREASDTISQLIGTDGESVRDSMAAGRSLADIVLRSGGDATDAEAAVKDLLIKRGVGIMKATALAQTLINDVVHPDPAEDPEPATARTYL